jgi:transcriptional regulator with XRE-family HTH domain
MVSKKQSELKQIFGKRIKLFRERKELNQPEFAKLMGYRSKGTVSQIEGGTIGMKDEKVARAAKILGVSPIILKLQADLPEDRLMLLADVIKLFEVPDAENIDAIEILVKNALAKI